MKTFLALISMLTLTGCDSGVPSASDLSTYEWNNRLLDSMEGKMVKRAEYLQARNNFPYAVVFVEFTDGTKIYFRSGDEIFTSSEIERFKDPEQVVK